MDDVSNIELNKLYKDKLNQYSKETINRIVDAPIVIDISNKIFDAVIESNSEEVLSNKLNSIIPSKNDIFDVIADCLKNLDDFPDPAEILNLMSLNNYFTTYALIMNNPKITLDELLEHIIYSNHPLSFEERYKILKNRFQKKITSFSERLVDKLNLLTKSDMSYRVFEIVNILDREEDINFFIDRIIIYVE